MITSPWGKIQSVKEDKSIPDVQWVATAGHGGCRVPLNRYRKFLSHLTIEKYATESNSSFAWFEEDSAHIIPLAEIRYGLGMIDSKEDLLATMVKVFREEPRYDFFDSPLATKLNAILNHQDSEILKEITQEDTATLLHVRSHSMKLIKKEEYMKNPLFVSSISSKKPKEILSDICFFHKITVNSFEEAVELVERKGGPLSEKDLPTLKKLLSSDGLAIAWLKNGDVYVVDIGENTSRDKFLISDYENKIQIA